MQGFPARTFTMSWIYLFIAGLLEIGWPVGLKLAQTQQYRALGFLMAAAFMGGSGFMLYMAQRTIPMGTAYAVWTGIGAAGAFAVGGAGLWRSGDAGTLPRRRPDRGRGGDPQGHALSGHCRHDHPHCAHRAHR